MSFEETCEELHNILSSNRSNKWLGQKKGDFKKAIEFMKSDIEKLQNDEKVEESDEKKSRAAECTNLLIDKIEYKPHTKVFIRFIDKFCKLSFNWNKELGNKDIKNKLERLDRLTRMENTIDESINILRDLLDRIEQYKDNRSESVELARHYLKSLEDEQCE